MIINKNILVATFCYVDDFSKIYERYIKNRLINDGRVRIRETKISMGEMLTILIMFHLSGIKCFKYYYEYVVLQKFSSYFPNAISYKRFNQLMPRAILPLSILLNSLKGEKTGIYFIDATKMPICHNKRINNHKTFNGLAQLGKSSYGWFLGFKLHMVINNKGEIMAIKITKGNVDDRKPVEQLLKNLKGYTYADKGYIDGNLFLKLYNKSMKLIYGIRNNMKNKFLTLFDKIMLRKRSLIESAFNILKNQMNIDHTRHRSPYNFLVNTLSALIAYCFYKGKPSIRDWSGEIDKVFLIQD